MLFVIVESSFCHLRQKIALSIFCWPMDSGVGKRVKGSGWTHLVDAEGYACHSRTAGGRGTAQ